MGTWHLGEAGQGHGHGKRKQGKARQAGVKTWTGRDMTHFALHKTMKQSGVEVGD